MVGLKNVESDVCPNEELAMRNYLEKLSENGTSAILRIKGDNPEIGAKDLVELVDVISNKSVNETLNGMVQKRFKISDLKQKVMKNCVWLMMIDNEEINENIITCIVEDDVDKFIADEGKIQTYGESVKTAPAHKPKQKELCIAEIKDPEGGIFWYRCMFHQWVIYGWLAQVYCIDYGKIDYVRAHNIRVRRKLTFHPFFILTCFEFIFHSISFI